jgi:hypothetical protein
MQRGPRRRATRKLTAAASAARGVIFAQAPAAFVKEVQVLRIQRRMIETIYP